MRARFPAALSRGSSSYQIQLVYFSLLDLTGEKVMMEKLLQFARLSTALPQLQALLSTMKKKQAGLGTVVSSKQAGFGMRSHLLSCLLCISLGLPFPLVIPYPGSLPLLICETYLTSGNAVSCGELTKSRMVQAAAARCADCIFTAQIILCCS